MRRLFPAAAALLLAAAAARAADIEVSLDPRLELLGAVQLLSTAPAPEGFERRAAPAAEAARSLRSLAGHRAVAAVAALPPRDFSYYTRADVFLRLSPPPELTQALLIPDMFVAQAGGRAALDSWLDAMRAFSREPAFSSYFAKERDLLAGPVSAFSDDVAKRDYVGKIERYTGLPFHGRYAIHPTPFVKTGSQVNSVVLEDDGTYSIQSVVGPEESRGKLDFRPDEFPGTAWHEIGHGILDTLSDLHQAEIERNDALERKLASRWNCYGGVWEQCVKEHVVRAVMIRLIALDLGEKAADQRLREEGEDKFPYLKPMIDSLRVYEKSRDKYPTIADYFPRLLDVFPAPPAAAPAAALPPDAPLAGGGDPGPNYVTQSVRPFATPGQRARALAYANLVASPSPDLRRKRAALELLAGRDEAAAADAGTLVAADPGDSGAALIAASVARKRGDDAKARAVEDAARARCASAPPSDPDQALACRSLASASRPGEDGPPAAGSMAAVPAPRVEFAVDRRVELLSVVAMLAYPDEFAALFPDGESAYAQDARRTFAGLKDDPAAALLKKIVARGQANVPAEMLLATPSGDNEERTEFLAALDRFAKRSSFDAFYARHAADYRAFVAEALSEVPLQADAGSAAAYLGVPFRENYRFILSPLLPSRFDSNSVALEKGRETELRMRSAMYQDRRPKFDFESFGAGVAHELTHTVTDPLANRYEGEIEAYGGEAPPRCADRWVGCVREQVVFAVTLRMLALKSGEAAYRAQLDDSVRRGFAQLPALCERLKEYEAARPAGGIRDFYPRLLDVFRDELKSSIRARAEAEVAGSRAMPLDSSAVAASTTSSARAAEAAPPDAAGHATVVFEVDPRVELGSLLLSLSKGTPPAARAFAPFARHRAVSEAAAIEARGGHPGFLIELLARLTDPPDLAVAVPIPGAYLEQAGGRARVLRFLDDARDFARRSDFMRDFETRRPEARRAIAEAREEFARALPPAAAEAYLGQPFAGAYTVALTSLLPGPGQTLRLSSDGRSTFLLRSMGDEGDGRFGLDSFGNSMTHELIHTVTDPLASSARGAGKPPAGCNDTGEGTWAACVQEHLVYAVELRVMAGALGEKVYRQDAERFAARGFPYLLALGDALKGYEADRARYPALRDFYPKLESALKVDLPADARAGDREAARRCKDRGVAAFLKGDLVLAESEFLQAAKADPDDAEPYLDLGVLASRAGRGQAAHDYLDRAVERGDRSLGQWEALAAALSSRAELWEAEHRPDQARADLRRALKAAAPDWSGRQGLAARLKALDAH